MPYIGLGLKGEIILFFGVIGLLILCLIAAVIALVYIYRVERRGRSIGNPTPTRKEATAPNRKEK